MSGGQVKPVRHCTSCGKGLALTEIVYSTEYPEKVATKAGTFRKGTLTDAPRVWCGADCAQATYELVQLGLMEKI